MSQHTVHDVDAPVAIFTPLPPPPAPQMVYNFPDESSFLIATVKGEQRPTREEKKVFRNLMHFSSVHRRARRRTPSDPEVVVESRRLHHHHDSTHCCSLPHSLHPSLPPSLSTGLQSSLALPPALSGKKNERKERENDAGWATEKQRDCV